MHDHCYADSRCTMICMRMAKTLFTNLPLDVSMIMVGPCTKSLHANKTILGIFVMASTVIRNAVLVFVPFGPVVEQSMPPLLCTQLLLDSLSRCVPESCP